MIVLTGGPQGGKTSILRAIKQHFGKSVITIPEVATVLFSNGFPMPGRDIEWSKEWETIFGNAVFATQQSFEDVQLLRSDKPKVIVCDRGLPDVIAHSNQGLSAFCRQFGLNEIQLLGRYDLVIHLPSLAVIDPLKYYQPHSGYRYASLTRAKKIEIKIRQVWENHPNRVVFLGSLEERKKAVIDIIDSFLKGDNKGIGDKYV